MKKIKNTFLAFFVTVLTSLNLVLPAYAEETTARTVNTAGFSVNVVGDGTVTLSLGDFTKTLSDGESYNADYDEGTEVKIVSKSNENAVIDDITLNDSTISGFTSGQRGLIDKLNKEGKTGSLKDALTGADVFIGVSAGHIVSKEMIASMNEKAIVFPMANPVPEIEPDDAKEAGAYIVGTGRSDHPNQINNVLAFPGIFKGALKAGATCINDAMKEAAVYAISSMVTEDMLDSEHIIVSALDPRVADVVAQAVADAAKESGVVRE